jgi:hypothetical protein
MLPPDCATRAIKRKLVIHVDDKGGSRIALQSQLGLVSKV